MSTLIRTPNNTNISMLSQRALPLGSKNPFLTPCDDLPHLPPSFPSFPRVTLQCHTHIQDPPFGSVNLSSSDDEVLLSHRLPALTTHVSTHCAPPGLFPDSDSDDSNIKEKTMAGVPTWPANLCLSFKTHNWLKWSHELLNALEMGQLDIYSLGILKCPDKNTNHASNRNWQGNDWMVLAYMCSHMFPTESQLIDHCRTSAEAFKFLQHRHEKRGGLSQIQLLQKMLQIASTTALSTTM
jgi:hypothetical protein